VAGSEKRLIRRRTDHGAAAVEFGLVLVPLLIIVFGIIQYGMYFWAMQAGTNATGEAVRRLTVGDCQDSTQLKQLLSNRLGMATSNPSGITTTVVYRKGDGTQAITTAPGEVGDNVDLTVTFDALNMHLPFIPMPDGGTVTRHFFGRVEDTTPTTNGCS
jgi:Flp pilus assembly protein TadG